MKPKQLMLVIVCTSVACLVTVGLALYLAGGLADSSFGASLLDGFQQGSHTLDQYPEIERMFGRLVLIFMFTILCTSGLTVVSVAGMFWRYSAVISKLKSGTT